MQRRYSRVTAAAWLQEAILNRDRSDGCWEWPFTRIKSCGHGQVNYLGKQMPAHAAALIFDGNPRPAVPNHWALHSCDNPGCVNLGHLRWGSARDNSNDMVDRERQARGTRVSTARLSEADVLTIRADARPYRAIAESFGVSKSNVWFIKQRKTWAHL